MRRVGRCHLPPPVPQFSPAVQSDPRHAQEVQQPLEHVQHGRPLAEQQRAVALPLETGQEEGEGLTQQGGGKRGQWESGRPSTPCVQNSPPPREFVG